MKSVLRNSLLISCVYCFLGIAWVLFSDTLLLNYTEQISNSETVELLAGVLFVICSAVTIFLLSYFLNKKYTQRLKNHLKNQQEILNKYEKRFRIIIEKTDDIVSLVDKNGYITYISPAFERVTGFSVDEITGKHASLIMHPEYAENAKSILENLLNNPGVVMKRTNKFLHKNGNYVCVEGSVVNLLNDKNVEAIVSNYKDVTESKSTETRLTEFASNLIETKNRLENSELKLKQAQAIAHVGSWELDFKSGVALWSDESCRIYGLLPKENKQTYEVWESFIHPDDKNNVLENVRQANILQQDYSFYHRILRRDGTVRFIYSHSHFEFDAAGKAVGLYGVAMDITEQKLAEQEIIRKGEELRDLSNYIQHIREEERKLVSRELHDELGQQLTALKMEIGWIISKQTNEDKVIVSKLQEIFHFSDGLIATVRRILADLRPAIIDDLGLIAALEWKCDDFTEKTGISCYFISNINERKFEDNFSINIYRILQESLTNIARHAEAKSVTVLVSENETTLFLAITDDGNGLCKETIKKGKTLGILGMKERAVLLGGELEMIGIPNKGTSIKLKLPLT
ncbi:MAG TPA: PAS domain S-box protein [Bacteroidia bacterium]|nr:PAS domain S-box protein [Bacteroidia bacterium]